MKANRRQKAESRKREIEGRKRKAEGRRWKTAGLLLSAYCLLVLLGCGHKDSYQKPLRPVKVQVVEKYSAGGGVRYSANILPNQQVILAFRIGGYIQEILQVRGTDGRWRDVQEGDRVAKGTVLARVREADYVAKVNQAKSQLTAAQAGWQAAKSQLAEAQAGWEHAKLAFDRATTLFATQSITKPEYEGAKAQFEAIQAKVDAAKAQIEATQATVSGAKAQLQEVELALRDAALTAPINAVVLKRQIEVGALVGPGTPAFALADTTSVKAVFGVPDLMVQNLKLGSSLALTNEAIPGVEFRGRITRIAPSADPQSRVFDVEVTVPNPRDQLKVGMIAALQVAEAKSPEPVAVVPLSAIVESKANPDGYAVFVVEEQNGKPVARLRNVKLGEAFGNLIAVTEGVKIGERVIVTGTPLVVDGEQVRITL
jgi:multidrug efflux system membrane fusion protein